MFNTKHAFSLIQTQWEALLLIRKLRKLSVRVIFMTLSIYGSLYGKSLVEVKDPFRSKINVTLCLISICFFPAIVPLLLQLFTYQVLLTEHSSAVLGTVLGIPWWQSTHGLCPSRAHRPVGRGDYQGHEHTQFWMVINAFKERCLVLWVSITGVGIDGRGSAKGCLRR